MDLRTNEGDDTDAPSAGDGGVDNVVKEMTVSIK